MKTERLFRYDDRHDTSYLIKASSAEDARTKLIAHKSKNMYKKDLPTLEAIVRVEDFEEITFDTNGIFMFSSACLHCDALL